MLDTGGLANIKYYYYICVCVYTGTIEDLAVSCNGELCCTVADDRTLKVFDVVSFGRQPSLRLTSCIVALCTQ